MTARVILKHKKPQPMCPNCGKITDYDIWKHWGCAYCGFPKNNLKVDNKTEET